MCQYLLTPVFQAVSITKDVTGEGISENCFLLGLQTAWRTAPSRLTSL